MIILVVIKVNVFFHKFQIHNQYILNNFSPNGSKYFVHFYIQKFYFRYIILHAGTSKGFIDGASLVFKSGNKTGDYHGEMNADNFEKWLKNDLLPKLEEPSMIVLDNASYHSRQVNKAPTTSSRKDEMISWLNENNVQVSLQATKAELLNLIKTLAGNKTFAVDQIIAEAGHEVLRLPPYHCQFNAIEMVWSQAKRYYDTHINKIKDPLETWNKALQNISPEQWSNYIRHTHNVIVSAWEKLKVTRTVHPLVIDIENSSSSSEFEDLDC